MAELSNNIRRPGGDLVSIRSPFARRVLLPAEADLCNTLGITKEEYFQFLEEVAAKAKERPKEYDLVPDIKGDPVTTFFATYGVQIAISVALSVVSYLLTPKPNIESRTNRRTPDIAGSKRFSPTFAFNSVQSLAELGEVIPLVFANYEEYTDGEDTKTYGGIRVASQLVWSQLVSLGRYQQLKILAMFSLGELAAKPEFKGYALGDLLLSNYNSEKIELENNNIPFVKKGSGSNHKKFLIPVGEEEDQYAFSGTRNPTTQSVFGVSNPMPNATYFRLPYELHRIGKAPSGNAYSDAVNAWAPQARFTLCQRRKNLGRWPARAGVRNIQDDSYAGFSNDAEIRKGNASIPKGSRIYYQIIGSGGEGDGIAYQKNLTNTVDTGTDNDEGYMKFGVKDVDAISQTMRETADDQISFGEQYLLGTALVRCVTTENPDGAPGGTRWENGKGNKTYVFDVLEEGKIQCTPNDNLDNHLNNPDWDFEGENFKLPKRSSRFYFEQKYNDLNDPATTYVLQKVSLGTVSNNRRCDITEIGLKSKVFKQMNFTNVNSKPTEEDLKDIFKNGSMVLGNINKHITRYSFFKVQIRLTKDGEWQDLVEENENHSGLFCVRGSSPEERYNYIRINHPRGQYEYRFFPWPGADVIKTIITNEETGIKVNLLEANNAISSSALASFNSTINNISVEFAGNKELPLFKSDISNTEWNMGASDDPSDPEEFAVTATVDNTGIPESLKQLSWSNEGDINNHSYLETQKLIKTIYTRFYDAGTSSVEAFAVPAGGYTTSSYTSVNYVSGDNATLILVDKWASGRGYNVNYYINNDHRPANEEGFGESGMIGWFTNDYIESSTLEFVPAPVSEGGGETIRKPDGSLLAAHYTNSSTGLAGKLIPIKNANIPGAYGYDSSTGAADTSKANEPGYGHPKTPTKPEGDPRFFYVRRIEVTPETRSQVVGYPKFVDLTGGSGSNASILFNIWHDPSDDRVFARWALDMNSRGQDYDKDDTVEIEQVVDPADSNKILFPGLDVQLIVPDKKTEVIESVELNPYDAAADYWLFNGDQSSHLDGPEHEIIYCNEIEKNSVSDYKDLAYAALKIDSSKEWTNFSQFSAYIKEGIKVHRLINDLGQDPTKPSNCSSDPNAVLHGVDCEGNGPTHLFPEIAYALLTDKTLGAGEIISTNSVNQEDMKEAAQFCRANKFFWDGMISNKVNLREFIFEQATYCLLDFTIVGGRFSLVPSVPYKVDYTIDHDAVVPISAMFNDGNTKDLEVSVIPPEDRQLFQANIIWRDEKENGFAETKSEIVKLIGGEDHPVKTFDLSGFCTNSTHANIFGKYVISAAEKTTHMITFKTSPNYVAGLKAGNYIRMYSTVQHTDRFRNGAILPSGEVVSKEPITSNHNIYIWNPSETAVTFLKAVDFDDLEVLQNLARSNGSLFTIVENQASNQCYKVESLTYGEDGLIELAASHVELVDVNEDTGLGKLAILQGWGKTNARFA
tara:strand:- start:1688 stop:6133 length:4446 start_codon:yes stop_codon:yes gene_type:complete